MTAIKLIELVMFLGVSGLGLAGVRLSPAAVINSIIKGGANG